MGEVESASNPGASCRTFKKTNHQIVADYVDEDTMDYKLVKFMQPTALLMGQELDDLIETVIAYCQ